MTKKPVTWASTTSAVVAAGLTIAAVLVALNVEAGTTIEVCGGRRPRLNPPCHELGRWFLFVPAIIAAVFALLLRRTFTRGTGREKVIRIILMVCLFIVVQSFVLAALEFLDIWAAGVPTPETTAPSPSFPDVPSVMTHSPSALSPESPVPSSP